MGHLRYAGLAPLRDVVLSATGETLRNLMRRIVLVIFKVLAMSAAIFTLVAETHAESLGPANKSCIDFGFKQNTKDYDECVRRARKLYVDGT